MARMLAKGRQFRQGRQFMLQPDRLTSVGNIYPGSLITWLRQKCHNLDSLEFIFLCKLDYDTIC